MKDKPKGILRSIENPFFVVVVLLATVFVAGPFVEPWEGRWGDRLLAATSSFALALGIVGAKPGRWTVRLGLGAAVLAVLFAAVARTDDDLWSTLTGITLIGLCMGALVTILGTVLRARSVRVEEIFAAIAAYLLLGFLWAFLYIICHHHTPQAFEGLGGVTDSDLSSHLTYYSFVTLTTLGYGEIVPTNALTRNLAVFEAVTGQLFIAVLLARLVALGTMSAMASKNPDE